VALVAAAALAVFLPARAGEFVWDDHFFLDGDFVRSPGNWLRAFVDPDPFGFVRPLRSMEFAFDYAAGRGGAALFHVHSILWHAAGAVLLLLVLRRLLGDGRAALAAALFWALHPVQVESVAWISCRGDVAAGACTMAAVLFALRCRGFDRDLAVSLAAAAVALLYKEAALPLCGVVLVLRWLGLTRAPVWPYAVVAALFLVYRQSVRTGPMGPPVTFVLGGSTAGTFATMIRAFGFYAAECLLPAPSVDWFLSPSTSFAEGAVLAWLAVHAALVASAVAARRVAPLWTLAVLWFYAFLAPVANWPVPLGVPTAERYLYLPLAGAAVAFGWTASRAPRAAWPAVVTVLVALAAGSFARVGIWKSDETLWRTTLADHESPRAHAFLGEHGRDAALALREEAAAMPAGPGRDESLARVNATLVESLDHLHAATDLWRRFERVPRPQGQFAQRAETNLANVAFLLGRDAEALYHADEALAIEGPALAESSYDRAFALLDLGFAPQAMEAMRRARADGMGGRNAEIAAFFADASKSCESNGMFAAAEAGYETALDAAADGAQREEIAAAREALRRRARPPGAADAERTRRAELDAKLAALPRSCPARREPQPAK
jgi:hypothetical protein